MKFYVEIFGPKGWEIVSEPVEFTDAVGAFARLLNGDASVRLTCERPEDQAAMKAA